MIVSGTRERGAVLVALLLLSTAVAMSLEITGVTPWSARTKPMMNSRFHTGMLTPNASDNAAYDLCVVFASMPVVVAFTVSIVSGTYCVLMAASIPNSMKKISDWKR